MKEIHVSGEKMARNGRKTAIYFESQISGIRLYVCMNFDAAVIFVTKSSLLFKLALAILSGIDL